MIASSDDLNIVSIWEQVINNNVGGASKYMGNANDPRGLGGKVLPSFLCFDGR